MLDIKFCKHCNDVFQPRRTNHLYCTSSCKTKASYKRNNYNYISGHYQKEKKDLVVQKNDFPISNELIEAIKTLETKIENIGGKTEINSSSISNAAIGSVAADATLFAVKKIFSPHSLPATKGDINTIRQELQNLKLLLQIKSS